MNSGLEVDTREDEKKKKITNFYFKNTTLLTVKGNKEFKISVNGLLTIQSILHIFTSN